jgi:hypothetical protein
MPPTQFTRLQSARKNKAVVQFSDEYLNLFGGPELSVLTACSAKELSDLPNYLWAAIGNRLSGLCYSDAWMLHLDLSFLRRTSAAFETYRTARQYLMCYVEGVAAQRHEIGTYLKALNHFENCISSIWQACEIYKQMEMALSKSTKKHILYRDGENPDLENMNKLANAIKHFDVRRAELAVTPIWITNSGLKSADGFVSFDQLHENLLALAKMAHVLFVEIPEEARRKSQGS